MSPASQPTFHAASSYSQLKPHEALKPASPDFRGHGAYSDIPKSDIEIDLCREMQRGLTGLHWSCRVPGVKEGQHYRPGTAGTVCGHDIFATYWQFGFFCELLRHERECPRLESFDRAVNEPIVHCLRLITEKRFKSGYALPRLPWSRDYPPDVQRRLNDIAALEPAWGGEDEIPPSTETLDRVLQVIDIFVKWCAELEHDPIYPRLFPGFMGQVELKYVHKSKQLLIEIPADPDASREILRTWTDPEDNEKTFEARRSESRASLQSELHWLLSD